MAVESDGCGRLEELAVNSTENPNVVVGSGGGSNDAVVLVNHLHELANDKRNRLDPFYFLLRAKKLALEILLLVLHVLLLDIDELKLPLQRLEAAVEVVLVGAGVAAVEVIGLC